MLNKARRGALKLTLPIGLCYTENNTIVLDPNVQVQATIREVFHSFEHTGSAFATVRHFRQEHLLFPRRVRCGPHQGELVWGEIEHHDVLRVLHHPAYAGAYVFGRTRESVDHRWQGAYCRCASLRVVRSCEGCACGVH